MLLEKVRMDKSAPSCWAAEHQSTNRDCAAFVSPGIPRDIAGQIDRLIEIIAEHADRPPRCTDNQRADSEDIEDDFL